MATDEALIRQIEDELNEPFTHPFKESTVDYYKETKDKVRYLIIVIA